MLRLTSGQINVSALYTVAQREIPHLLELANQDKKAAFPSIIVTSSISTLSPSSLRFPWSRLLSATWCKVFPSPTLRREFT